MGRIRGFWLLASGTGNPDVPMLEDQRISTRLVELAEPVVLLLALADAL